MSMAILDAACREYGVTREVMRSPALSRKSPNPHRAMRDDTMYRMRLAGLSFPRIAHRMGLSDHTSVIAAVERHCALHDLPIPMARKSVAWSPEEDRVVRENCTSPGRILHKLPHRSAYAVEQRRRFILSNLPEARPDPSMFSGEAA